MLRRGIDVLAAAVLAQQSGARFSHVGMIVISDGRPLVIHSTPPEPGFAGGVHSETLEAFASPDVASDLAIYRIPYLDSVAKRRVRDYLFSQLGRPFDLRFQYSDDSELYCTELVLKALQRAGLDLVATLPRVQAIGMSEPAFSPDAIRLIANLGEIPADHQ